ncbi:MAG: type III secretion system outer membrane ring subunit SctC [Pacificimonas sp.]
MALPAEAARVPAGDRAVELSAREQPVGAFLSSLFGRIGVPVAVSPGVAGAVNGRFDGEVQEIADDIASAYNLALYYDGAVMHVYSSRNISTRSFPAGSNGNAIRSAARELGLPDDLNRLRTTRGGLLVASGTPRFLDQISELADAVGSVRDEQTPRAGIPIPTNDPVPLAFRVFPLKYGWAHDVTMRVGDRETTVPGIASILRAMVMPSEGSRLSGLGDGVYRERFMPPTVPSMRGYDTVPSGSDRLGYPDARGGGYANGFVGAAYTPDGRYVPDAPYTASRNPIEDAVRIQADKRLNAVIVRDTPDRLKLYDDLIAALDREPQMVEIEATIIDIDVDKARDLGIDWRLSDSEDFSIGFGNGTTSDLRLRPGTDVDSITPLSRGLSISSIITLGDVDFLSRITALAENGAAKIITRPQILTLSNNEAIFDQTETFYVEVAGEDEVDLFNIAAGTTLRVTPHVFAEENSTRIRVLVTIEDGTIQFTRSVDGLPTVRRSAVNTQALIQEGQSLLLGGMTQQIDIERTIKIPLLGDIPVIGRLFRMDSKNSRRIERLFLISPRLASSFTQVTAESYDVPLDQLKDEAEGDPQS